MKRSRAFQITLLLPVLLLGAGHAGASDVEVNLSHPSNACIERRAVEEIGDEILSQVLAAAGLVETPKGFEKQLLELSTACVEIHGEPEGDTVQLGRYVAANALKTEASSRLNALKFDLNWLGSAIQAEQEAAASDPVETSKGVLELLSKSPPAGYPTAEQKGSEELIGVLVYSFVVGSLEMEGLAPELQD